jgi:hypothetical protein
MHRIIAATSGVVALIATGCAGCSAIGGGSRAAGSGTGTGTGTPAAHGSSPGAAVYHRAAECIRTHGVPGFPEPTQNPQTGEWDLPPGTRKPPQSTMNACRSILSQIPEANGDGDNDERPLTPAEMAKAGQFAQCMRQHGLADFPDPSANGDFVLPQRYEALGKGGIRAQLMACRKYNSEHTRMTIPRPGK